MKDQIRWGIIGCGDVTEKKSGPAYQQVEGFELGAVMRRNLEKAKDYADRHRVSKYYDKAQELINDPEIDAIYIATPPDSHLEYALMVAEAGKICCVEKPMGRNFGECKKIIEAFSEKNQALFVAYYRRTLPRFLQVKKWLEEGKIGDIRHIGWNFCKEPSDTDKKRESNWRTDAEIAPGGYFDDLASHGLDLFAYLLGEITEASGSSINQQGYYSGMDSVSGSWLHNGQITGSGFWNFSSAYGEDQVTIYGSEGKIKFTIFDDQPIELISKSDSLIMNIPHPETIQMPHVEAMRDSLLKDVPHPSTGETGARANWVMDRILGN